MESEPATHVPDAGEAVADGGGVTVAPGPAVADGLVVGVAVPFPGPVLLEGVGVTWFEEAMGVAVTVEAIEIGVPFKILFQKG